MIEYSRENSKLIVIVGPTAIGKSDLAIYLAEKYNADIFSADSRQIYKEMHIGTAKPPEADKCRVKHHFIDIVSVKDTYSAGHFAQELRSELNLYFHHKSIAILVGGTGFYINAALFGLDDFPDVPESVKTHISELYSNGGLSLLQSMLAAKDPDYYRIVDTNNPMRLIRALEIIEYTGKSYSEFLKGDFVKPEFQIVPLVLDMPRSILYERINLRVDMMMEVGLVNEVRTLLDLKTLPALNTVGYTELFDYLEGKTDIDTAVELIKRNTRRYAKRQLTWFKNKYPDWPRFLPSQLKDIEDYIDSQIMGE